MQTARRRRRQIPWLDLALLLVIVGAIVFWWTRSIPPSSASLDNPATPIPASQRQPGEVLTMTPLATSSPTPTAAPATPTPSPTPPFITYKIAAGDTLLGIAGKFGASLDQILTANALKADVRLAVGQTLKIPTTNMKAAALALGGTPAPTATPDNSTLIYRVKAGDTLLGIAGQFKSTINAILEANKLKPDALLHIGQVLIIPRGTPTPTLTPTVAASPTSTAGPPLAAPILLGPARDAVLSATDPVVLRWSAVGTLGEEDWYVVHVWSLAPNGPDLEEHVKGTSLRLDAAQRLPDYVSERGWRWQVIVARHHGHVAEPDPMFTPAAGLLATATPLPGVGALLPLSAPSEERTFTWN